MAYKILYIEDLDPDTRILTIEKENFKIKPYKPSESIEEIVSYITKYNPDLLILDYILTKGSKLKYCNAPTIASTLRTLSVTKKLKERPIVLMSTQENIVELYKKDYTSHDLFDYAITKIKATKEYKDKFVEKCISFIEGYKCISESSFDLSEILKIDKIFIHSKLFIYLNENNKSPYEYSRFIFEHVIRCSGMLIGEDILSARLGVSKNSSDWEKLKEKLEPFKYKGILSDAYDRWWMSKIESWWTNELQQKYSLRHSDAQERLDIISKFFNFSLDIVESSDKNLSSHYWTICKKTKLALDPIDGIEILEEEFKPWQDKDYVSVDGYLSDIEKYSKIISPVDKLEMRNKHKHGSME